MGLLIGFFVLSIAFSFLCSVLEAVLLSVTPSYVNRQVQDGTSTGLLLQEYKKDIDRPLSAILTLNTIAHTVGAIGVGAQAGTLFGEHYINLGIMNLSIESIIAVVMTLAILILSEIIPKTIGANMWRELAPFTVRTLRFIMFVLRPFVWVSQLITKRLKKDKGRSVFSRADFTAMTSVGAKSGALAKNESTIISNLLRLDKLTVRDIMTPRTVMIIANESLTVAQFYEKNSELPVSRIPVYEGKPDHITGMVLKNDILLQLAKDKDSTTLASLRRPVYTVKATDTLHQLLETFVQKHSHIAIVIDSYGSVVGLVTMEDLFETILGMEIMDESDEVEDLQKYARKQWEERAKRPGLLD